MTLPADEEQPVLQLARVTLPFDDRTIEPLVDKVFPLERVKEAHETMERSGHFGKIVLAVAP